MIDLNTRCNCGAPLVLDAGHLGYVVHCPRCLDPESEGLGRLQGKGSCPGSALQNWYDRREELGLEPELSLTDIATAVVAKHDGSITVAGLEFSSLQHAEAWAKDDRAGIVPIYFHLAANQKASNDT